MAKINLMVSFLHGRILRMVASALVLAVFASGLAFLPYFQAEPASAQTSSTLEQTTRTLNFRLAVDGGVEPVLTVIVDADSYCFTPEGAAVALGNSTTITFTTHEAFDNFACSYNVYFEFEGFHSCSVTVTKSGESTDLSLATTSIRGDRLLKITGQGTPNYRTGVGALKAVSADGANIAGGADLSNLVVTVDECVHNLAVSGNSVYVVNAEPNQGMRGVFTTLSGCRPEGGFVLDHNLEPLDRSFVRLATECVWNFNFADAREACNAIAVIYVANENSPTKIQGSSRQTQIIELHGSLTGSSLTGSITYNNKRLQMIILLRSTDCVEVIQATVAIQAPSDLQDQPVRVSIYAPNARTSGECSVLDITVTARTPVNVWLKRRERFSSTRCSYVFEPERIAGGLQLATTERSSQSFDILNGRYFASIDYTTKQVPIQISLVFPTTELFTTEDKVSIRIYSPGQCGALTTSVGGSLSARVGTYRTFPAYPGTTQVLGREANTVGVDPPYIYTLPTKLTITDSFGRKSEVNCSISATVSTFPSSCMPNGERTQTIDATDATESFDLFFVFTCNGNTGVITDPDGEPPTPVTPDSDPDNQAEFNLRLTAGWQMRAYNGVSGTTPQAFLNGLGTGVSSVWAWDSDNQEWLGYHPTRLNTLKQLTAGQVLFMYVPAVTVATLRPGSLLSVAGDDDSVVLKPGLNLIAYRGPTLAVGRAFNSSSVTAVDKWNNDIQDWERYDPASTQNDLSAVTKGDLLFVHSSASVNIRVDY